ncbi:MAG: DUF222 domain-containing protein [Actinomycetota bacterium]
MLEQERAWDEGEASTVALMGTINLATAQLVATIRALIDSNGWHGVGIQSVEHWLTWKAGLSSRRAAGLVRIARRVDELPACWALFSAGKLTEDAMVRIARRVPAQRDAEVAGWAPHMLISQLTRALKSCPELPLPGQDERPPDGSGPQRSARHHTDEAGWGRGDICLPPDENALLNLALGAARDAEYRDRNGLAADAEVTSNGSVTWADALVRLASAGLEALDPTFERSGHPAERTKIVLHHDIDAGGRLGPGQLHAGAVIPATLSRFLSCDAEVLVATYTAGRLLGIHPTERTVNRHLRRLIERRDQGCTHPLCNQTRRLHIHHIQHWEHGGLTDPANLTCLCQRHHRQLHHGELQIEGDPEAGTLRFYDARGRPIEPPDHGSPGPLHPTEPSPFTPPLAERLDPRWFGWN